jgi:peptidoglycan/xylan/chitin deacetylase (PgdA/CDA1 family)
MLMNLLLEYMDKTHFFDFYGNLRRKITKSQVMILYYHRINPSNDKWHLKHLDPKSFEEQIKYLLHNFDIISLNNLNKLIINGKLPKKAVVLTFDDGYKDNYKFAYPILKKYNLPATIYLSTGPIEEKKLFWTDEVRYILLKTDLETINLNKLGFYHLGSDEDKIRAASIIISKLKKMENTKKNRIIENLVKLSDVNIPDKLGKQDILSWNEIKRMNKNGVDFGAHTVNHPILTQLTIDEAKFEIQNSKNSIEENLEIEVDSFAYPNGDYNHKILSIVKKAGFNSSVTVKPGFVHNSIGEIYQLNRSYGEYKDLNLVKFNLCGLWGDILKLTYFRR